MRISTALCYGLALGSLAMVAPVQAHVTVLAPNGGERIQTGSVYSVEWTIVIAHDLQNWDIWYSTTGAGGPWIEVAMDLPAGDGSKGSVHTYEWTVPETLSEMVRVRVRMDNNGTDYEDVSNADLAIVSGIVLEQTAITRGKTALFRVSGADPGETAHFLYSLAGVGGGPQIDALGGLQIDLLAPVFVLGRARTNKVGQALLRLNVPADLPIIDLVWTQAVIRRGDGGESSIKTNWNDAVIN